MPLKEPSPPSALQEEGSTEEVLALQYEYINRGDFEQAYSLFAQRSRREVSLEQYRAFFEENAPYSVTDYLFSSVRIEGDSATVDAEFTVNSAAGVERLQRTQELVREGGNWRVVMRPEQIAAFSARENASEQSIQKTNTLPKEEKQSEASKEEEVKQSEASIEEEVKQSEPIELSGTGDQVTEPFSLRSGLATFRSSYQNQSQFSSSFIVELIDSNGRNVPGGLVANQVVQSGGTAEPSRGVRVGAGEHRLNVTAEGPWTITIEQ